MGKGLFTMDQLQPLAARVRVPVCWKMLHREEVSESDFVRAISQLPVGQLLPGLIRLLQYGDASEPPKYETLDHRICDLFPTRAARRIAERLSAESHWIFFSQWQLLFAIKLLCTFGSRDAGKDQANDQKFIDFLLMTNSFYSRGETDLSTEEGFERTVQKVALLGYSLVRRELPTNLIGRYSELLGRLAAPTKRSEFNGWVDIQNVVKTKLGVQLETFKAVLFALYRDSIMGSSWPDDGRAGPQLGRLIPDRYFANTKVDRKELNRTLERVSTSPDEICEKHRSEYGDKIGNPMDLRIILRKPAITLPDDSLAGISGQLLVQRYTCGLYWDIHDALPDGGTTKPNRQSFQTFFGELHEGYGRDVLDRIAAEQLRRRRKIRLLSENEYRSGSGANPDNLVIETIGSTNTRCTMVEFKVGRPRYKDSLVEGDIRAFQEDLKLKIEDGLDQEIDFCRQVQAGQRDIPGLPTRDVTGWFFVIVVTDPFPSMDVLLKPLRKKLADSDGLGDARRYGPFVLSLAELEQLETLPNRRVSELLIDWANGPHALWPFNTFYAHRTRGRPSGNSQIAKLFEEAMDTVTNTLFGRSIHRRQPAIREESSN